MNSNILIIDIAGRLFGILFHDELPNPQCILIATGATILYFSYECSIKQIAPDSLIPVVLAISDAISVHVIVA